MRLWALIATAVVTTPVLGGTVTLDLASPSDGASVSAGDTIFWTISATVSNGDNAGLALVGVDLVQDGGNPESLDLPTGGGAPAGMAGFEAPAGISNPTGYGGTPLGTVGAQNLIQIGGAQNVFGVAGSSVGTDFNVDGGIGQSGAQDVADGSFLAPATEGTYTYQIQNGFANVLDAVNAPPANSPVSPATVALGTASFSFTVGATACLGDTNGDGLVNITDLGTLLANFGLTGGATLSQGDVNGDGDVNITDLGIVLAQFGSTCP